MILNFKGGGGKCPPLRTPMRPSLAQGPSEHHKLNDTVRGGGRPFLGSRVAKVYQDCPITLGPLEVCNILGSPNFKNILKGLCFQKNFRTPWNNIQTNSLLNCRNKSLPAPNKITKDNLQESFWNLHIQAFGCHELLFQKVAKASEFSTQKSRRWANSRTKDARGNSTLRDHFWDRA